METFTVQCLNNKMPVIKQHFTNSEDAIAQAVEFVASGGKTTKSKDCSIVITIGTRTYNIDEAYKDIVSNGLICLDNAFLFLSGKINGSSQNSFFLGRGYGRKENTFDLVWGSTPSYKKRGNIIIWAKPDEVISVRNNVIHKCNV